MLQKYTFFQNKTEKIENLSCRDVTMWRLYIPYLLLFLKNDNLN